MMEFESTQTFEHVMSTFRNITLIERFIIVNMLWMWRSNLDWLGGFLSEEDLKKPLGKDITVV